MLLLWRPELHRVGAQLEKLCLLVAGDMDDEARLARLEEVWENVMRGCGALLVETPMYLAQYSRTDGPKHVSVEMKQNSRSTDGELYLIIEDLI